MNPLDDAAGLTRRQFLDSATKTTLAAALAGMTAGLPAASHAQAAGSDRLRVGLVGCGGRGLHDMTQFLTAVPDVTLVAMGDLFDDRLQSTLQALGARFGERVAVPANAQFLGFEAHRGVLAAGVDLVVYATPPHFRPDHFQAAVDAGKHVFLEKPIAVDPAGIRAVLQTAGQAEAKNLKVVVGTQMRRIEHLVAGMQRLQDGAIGTIEGGTCFRIEPGLTDWGVAGETPQDWNTIPWQIRRWLFVDWLSGDFIVEQSVHNLDLMNWALGTHPERCFGFGGRQSRTDAAFGNVFDHLSVDFIYPNDVHVQYQGTQIDNVSTRMDQKLIGTKGIARFDFGNFEIEGANPWRFEGQNTDPEQRQFRDLVQAIREDRPVNEARRLAESSLTAIMGRMSAYTGQAVSWNWVMNASALKMGPASYGYPAYPLPAPAQPGVTRLV